MLKTSFLRPTLDLSSHSVENQTETGSASVSGRIWVLQLLLSKVIYNIYFSSLINTHIFFSAFTQEQLKELLEKGQIQVLTHVLTTEDIKVCANS
jgi:hypothetical protein